MAASVLACGSAGNAGTSNTAADASDDGAACEHITGFKVDLEPGCYEAEAPISGVCALSSTQYPSAAIGPVCLVGPDGATYISEIRSDTELLALAGSTNGMRRRSRRTTKLCVSKHAPSPG